MDARSLIRELGSTLGLSLELSSDNTCQVVFDTDAVDFEVVAYKGRDEALFLIAELGLRSNEPAVLSRLLEANYLGGATGNATIGLNAESFMLHRQLVLILQQKSGDHVKRFSHRLCVLQKLPD